VKVATTHGKERDGLLHAEQALLLKAGASCSSLNHRRQPLLERNGSKFNYRSVQSGVAASREAFATALYDPKRKSPAMRVVTMKVRDTPV
jgi:hypothetical protein